MIRKLLVIITIFSGLSIRCMAKSHSTDSAYFFRVYDSVRHYYSEQQFDNAIRLARKLLETTKRPDSLISTKLVKLNNLMGVIYSDRGDYELAADYLKNALKSTKDSAMEGVIYVNITNIAAHQGELSKVLSYSNMALQMCRNRDPYKIMGDIYHNIGYAYINLNKWSKALEYTRKAAQIYLQQGNSSLGTSYNNLGFIYQKLGKYDKSYKYYLKAENTYKGRYRENQSRVAYIYLAMADLFCDMKEYKRSLTYYRMAEGIILKTCGVKHYYTSTCYSGMGRLFHVQGQYTRALSYYQKALISKLTAFNDTSVYDNPLPTIYPDLDLLDLLKRKALSFEKLSWEQNQVKNLEAALATLKLCAGYIEKLRIGYLSEASKLLLSSNENDTYEAIVRISMLLYGLTHKEQYRETAFEFSERSKYAVLRDVRNDAMARSYAGVPDSITKKERNINYRISDLGMELQRNSKKEQPDSNRIRKLHDRLFRLTQQQEKMLDKLEKAYPAYYHMKYENKVVDINALKSDLADNHVLVEYLLTDSLLYTFVVSKDTFALFTRAAGEDFHRDLEFCINFLHSDHSMDYVRYCRSAYGLYQSLIRPEEPLLRGKELIIVPDVALATLSFDALLTQPFHKTIWADYRNKAYLIRKYTIGYSLSATLLCNEIHQSSHKNRHFAGFAPAYGPPEDSLPPIPGTLESMNDITSMLSGTAFTGRTATKQTFEEKYNHYGLLHFYLYGYEDTLDPSLSRMIFAPDSATGDNDLFAWEVNTMQMNAGMVVLVSGYSGSGPLSKGEGVLSIGRSFMNAGCASAVLSLWSAYSKPSFDILETFYAQLRRGKNKAEAMHFAKLQYLEKADPLYANPRYWSGLVVVGNPRAIFRKNSHIWLFLAGGLVILALFGFAWRWRLKD